MQNTTIIGDYKLHSKLSDNGISQVWKAHDSHRAKDVVVKLYMEHARSKNVEQLLRFQKEAEQLRLLKHEHSAEIYDSGESKGDYYIAMEYIEGNNFKTLLSEHTRFDLHDFFSHSIPLAETLAFFHNQNIIHGGIKPENIMITSSDHRLKILDFRVTLLKDLHAYLGSNNIESFSYMSPEQSGVLRRTVDGRSDIYSLGILFYRMLAGTLPYEHSDIYSLIHMHIASHPKPLRLVDGRLRIIEKVIDTMLAKDIRDRYRSAEFLVQDLKLIEKSLSENTNEPLFIPEISRIPAASTDHIHFSGRSSELSALLSLYSEALDKKGSIVFISGEAGIGKSRLVEALQEQILRHGGIVIGSGYKEIEHPLPYSGFVKSLQQFFNFLEMFSQETRTAIEDAIRNLIGDSAGLFTSHLPKIRELVPSGTLEPVGGQNEKIRFDDLLIQLFSVLGKHFPVLVIYIDNIQWADNDTLVLMEKIANQELLGNLFIIVTARPTTNGDNSTFSIFSKKLADNNHVRKLDLGPLSQNDVRQMVYSMLGEESSDITRLGDILFTKTAGIALFVKEFMLMLLREGKVHYHNGWKIDFGGIDVLPFTDNVANLLLDVIEKLFPNDQQVLSMASVLGKEFDFSRLASCFPEKNPAEVFEAIESAKKHSILLSDSSQIYFSHDIIHKYFYSRIPKNKCRDYHERIARTLETGSGQPDNDAYTILYHYQNSHNTDKKIEYLVKAGYFAKSRNSYHDAARFFKEALKMAGRRSGLFIPEAVLHEQLGEALQKLGNYAESEKYYTRAMDLTSDPIAKAELCKKLSYTQSANGRYEEAVETLFLALYLLGQRVSKRKFFFGIKLVKELILQFVHSRFPFRVNKTPVRKDNPAYQQQKLFQMIGWVCLWAMKRDLLIYSHFKALNLCDRSGISEEGVELLLTHCAVLASIDGPPAVIRLFFRRLDKFLERIYLALTRLGYPKALHALYLAVTGAIHFNSSSFEKIEDARALLRQQHTVTYLQEISNCAAQVYEMCGQFGKLLELSSEVHSQGMLYGNQLLSSISDLYEGIALYYQGRINEPIALLESAFNSFQNVADNVNCQYTRLFLLKAFARKGDYQKVKIIFDDALATIQREHQVHPLVISRIFPFFLEELIDNFIPFASNRYEKSERLKLAVFCYKKSKALSTCYDSQQGLFIRIAAKYHWIVRHDRKKALTIFQQGMRFFTDSPELYNRGIFYLRYAEFLQEEDPAGALNLFEKAYLDLEKCGASLEMRRAEHKIHDILASRSNEGVEYEGKEGGTSAFTITRELDTVLDIGKKLSLVRDIDVLIKQVLDHAIQLVGAEQGEIFIYEGAKPVSRYHVALKDAEKLPASMGVISMVDYTGKPLVISDARHDPRLKTDPVVVQFGLKSILCVPLVSRDKRIGILYLCNHYVGGLFSNHELDLLNSMAGQAAIAIENSLLFRETSRLQMYLKSIIESMPGAIIALDAAGRINYINSTAIQYFPELGNFEKDITLWHTVPALAKYHQAFLHVVRENRFAEYQKETFNKRILRIVIFPLMSEESKGAVVKIDDVTEAEKIQQHLIQAQKMEAAETLVGGLAHDFNNILSGMMMTIDYLNQFVLNAGKKFTRQDIDEEISVLSTSIDRASALVGQLLTISMKKEISVTTTNLNDAARRVISICRQSFDKSIDFVALYSDIPAVILADVAQLEQVILNLAINASHAMTIMRPKEQDWGGILKITIKQTHLENPVGNGMEHAPGGAYWCLSVEDSGVGMDEETAKKIFEPFFTTKETGKGSGLGLAMVYSIVKRFNGHIHVYSEQGKGSTFHVYFPVEHAKVIQPLPATDATLRHKGHGTALVIDDEVVIRSTLERILAQTGYTVMSAADGKTGLELYHQHYKDLSVVLLDMVMPKESGKTVFVEMLKHNPKQKVILMSGFRQDERVEEVLALGQCLFLQKPFNQEELFRAIERILE